MDVIEGNKVTITIEVDLKTYEKYRKYYSGTYLSKMSQILVEYVSDKSGPKPYGNSPEKSYIPKSKYI